MVVGVVDPSTKTGILDYYYANYGEAGAVEAMIADLQAGTVPEGYDSVDLFGVLLEMEADLDPDDPSLSYLWADAETGEMLQEFWMQNSADAELTMLIEDVEGFMNQCGLDTSTLGMTETVITDYVEEFGPLEYGASSDDLSELGNLLSIIKVLNPGLYMIIRTREVSQLVAEDIETLLSDQEEVRDRLLEIPGDMEGLTDTDDQAEMAELQQEMKQLEQMIATYDEIVKQLIDILQKNIETGSDLISSQSRLASTILNN